MPSNYRGLPANVFYLGPVGVSDCISALSGAAIQVTATGHGMTSGDTVDLTEIQGTIEANGQFIVTVVDVNNFTIPVAFVNAYTTGGNCAPLTYLVTSAAISDGDAEDAASVAADVSVCVDRTAAALVVTGKYKLAQLYYDQFFDDNAPLGNTSATPWIQSGTPGQIGSNWALVNGSPIAGAAPARWPWSGNPTTIDVQPGDLVEVRFEFSFQGEPGTSGHYAAMALAITNTAPGAATNYKIQPGSKQFVMNLTPFSVYPTSLGCMFAAFAHGPITVALAGTVTNNSTDTFELTDGYSMTINVWRPTTVPQ